ncbi:anti-sigma factor domain-containing protein [Cytobacillus gottheilii]|uniref:anti-sigma factor domain-containing protein n=1 Tax=Cytobacillus gottheilii TaxID=859144 RepID=UPI0009BA6A30|nr:anti-sigma factor domain-containing protein [Cytobacillus gottheilii]
MKKGVIIEIDLDYITLLTPNGEFVRTPNKGESYLIGEEIEFTLPEAMRREGRFKRTTFFASFNKGAVFTATVLIAIITSIAIPFIHESKTYGYVSIDTESSLELELNSENEVVDMIPFNQAGAAVMDNLNDWENNHIKEVASSVIVEMKNQGYLEINQPLVVATVRTNEGENNLYDQQLQSELLAVQADLLQDEKVEVKVIHGTLHDRKLAKENGLTVGLYKSSFNQNEDENMLNANTETESNELNTVEEDGVRSK